MRAFLPFLFLIGCATPGLDPAEQERSALAAELSGRVAGRAQSCVSTYPAESLRIVDSATLVYGAGGTVWVNRLAGSCPGLRPNDTIIVEVHGSQYCKGDLFRTVTPGSSIPGPMCPLGDFVPYRKPR